jgi:hypothetical protein
MITLKVTPDGAEAYSVTATSRDVLTWEKTTKGNKSFLNLITEPNLIDLYRVAHLASWRQGLFAGNFQEFEATCEVTAEMEEEESDDAPDPTQSAHSADDSSTSPSAPASPRPSGRKKASAQS